MARLSGLVLEAGDGWAIILNSQGEYRKIKTKTPLQVGEIWQDSGYNMKFALAAAILLVFLGGAFSILPVVAYAQVSSGIELGLNRWEWVVSARPLNDEGRELLQEVDLRGKSLDKAVELIVDNTLVNDNSDNKEIVVNVVTKKPGKEQDRQRIKDKVDSKVKQVLDKDKLNENKDNKNSNSHDNVNSESESSANKPANKDNQTGGKKPDAETNRIGNDNSPNIGENTDRNSNLNQDSNTVNKDESQGQKGGPNLQDDNGNKKLEDKDRNKDNNKNQDKDNNQTWKPFERMKQLKKQPDNLTVRNMVKDKKL